MSDWRTDKDEEVYGLPPSNSEELIARTRPRYPNRNREDSEEPDQPVQEPAPEGEGKNWMDEEDEEDYDEGEEETEDGEESEDEPEEDEEIPQPAKAEGESEDAETDEDETTDGEPPVESPVNGQNPETDAETEEAPETPADAEGENTETTDGENAEEKSEGESATEEPKKKMKSDWKDFFKSLPKKFDVWLNGTDEKPLPLYSLRAKFWRWRKIHFHGYLWLRVLSYDRKFEEYVLREDLVPRSEIPRDAVHCTNEKRCWFLCLHKIKHNPELDNGFGAINAWIYMMDVSMDEALLALWKDKIPFNPKMLAIIGMGVVFVIFYVLFMM